MKDTKKTPVLLLSQKLMLGGMFLVLLTICLTVMMVLRLNITLQERRLEETLHDLGEMVAANPLVIHACQDGSSNGELILYLDHLIAGISDLDVITVADMHSRRLYHVDRLRVGERVKGGDEGPVLRGTRYFSRAVGTLGDEKRYLTPVFDTSGKTQTGFVLVGSLIETIQSQRREIYVGHLRVAAVVVGVALALTWLFGRSLKKSLLGYEPSQLSKIYLERGEVLNALEEGIVAVDNGGHISMANKAAISLLNLTPADIGKSLLDELFPQIRIGETLKTGEPYYNSGITWGDVNILCDRIPVNEHGSVLGAVAILRNRTEQTHLAEELTGVNHMVDALRSNTHEFMNKLHVILGLLRIGAPDEAEKYITSISREHSEVIAPVMQKIQNKTLGALILGKMSHCRELDINFNLVGSSSVPANSQFLSGNAFETLVGNLVENAIEAVNAKAKGDGEREVSLLVHEDEHALMINVDDTGEGMTEEDIERIRKGRYSTKGRHRGTGMRLIHSVLASSGGEMQIDSEKGVGTSISVCFTKEGKL
ncbi:MAG: sensor histidine kinase [Pyramidobacter sp.]|nr:sensor histidine kinase [Pyramidobacter sp.]